MITTWPGLHLIAERLDSNLRPTDRKSSVLTTRLSSHTLLPVPCRPIVCVCQLVVLCICVLFFIFSFLNLLLFLFIYFHFFSGSC